MTSGKVLFVIAHKGFHPVEYGEPKKIVEEANFIVVTTSDQREAATDKEGNTTRVDLALSEVNVTDYDGIFFIGGPGTLEHLDNPHSYRIIKDALTAHLPLGAICSATRILARAHALTRKHATGWNGDHELEKIYEEYEVKYLPEPVVVDDNVITAVGPSAAKTFGHEIVVLLHNNKGWG